MELVKKIVGKRKILLFGFVFGSRGGWLVQVVGGVRFVSQRGDLRGEGLDLVRFGFSRFARDGLLGLCLYSCWSLGLCLFFCVWLTRNGKKMLENLGVCSYI